MSSETIPCAGVKLIRRISPALLFVATSLPAQQPSVPSIPTWARTTAQQSARVSPSRRQYFDQGLRLVYGFNHAEAIRSFTRATELDPTCAMCWWGIAYAYGPHVNAGMDSASGVKAYEAAQQALSQSRKASAWERAYIGAVAARYAPVPPADRAAPRLGVCARDGRGGPAVSRRSRCPGALRRVADGSPALELLDAGGEAVPRDGGDRAAAGARHRA